MGNIKKKQEDRIRELEEILEALVIAMPKEEASYYFYMDLANTTEHEGTREMFFELAGQKLKHKQGLEKCIESLQKDLIRLKAEKAQKKQTATGSHPV